MILQICKRNILISRSIRYSMVNCYYFKGYTRLQAKEMNLKIFFGFICLFKLGHAVELIVNTPNGKIQGKIEVTQFSNVTYYSFYSIRYGEPPVGKLRFQAPQPVQPWDDIYDATYEKSYCFQVTTDSGDENEDCLFLNVFSPKDPTTSKSLLPVMFFLHGGGFKEGHGEVRGGYGPEFFVDYDVILVSANYRLGPFGFLATGDGVIPGNAGLKDVHLALKWVNKNIQFFGGDPEKVTIFGHSAGSASVSYQLLYPESEGLFRAAILQSGTSINPWAYQRDQVDITYKTAAYINDIFNSTENRNSTLLLEFLQTAEAREIDGASNSFYNTESSENLQIQQGFYYAPIMETHLNNPFLTKAPYDSFKNGDYIKVPMMIGTTAEEGLYMLTDYFHWTLAAFDNNLKLLVPRGMHISDENVLETVGKLIKEEYTPDQLFQENILAGIQFNSDQDFSKSLIEDAKFQASNGVPVYFYEFAYHGKMGDFPQTLPGAGNVSHGEDQNYLFNRELWFSKLNNADISQFPENDQMTHKRYLKLLELRLAYLGVRNPTPETDDLLQNIVWPQVEPDQFRYLQIGENLALKQDLKKDKLAFWENTFRTYGLEPFETF